MPDDTRPADELELVELQTADGADVIEGIDPDISQDADPHPGG